MSGDVWLLRGDDPTLLSRAIHELVERLLGDADRSLVVEELTAQNYLTSEANESISCLVDAAQTPPFLTDFRIVVGRELGLFSKADQVQPLIEYLENPLETTHLVLVWEKGPEQTRLGQIPKVLSAALEGVSAETLDARLPKGKKGLNEWLADQVAASGLSLDRGAVAAMSEHLGEDRSRVPAVLDTLFATFGSQKLTADDVLPYLGERGEMAPWELTDALASADIALSLDRARRMTGAGGRHPLQIMASLHAHYARLLRIDGSGLAEEKAAAEALGMKGSTYPAKKALQQSRKLGTDRITRAIGLLAAADLDLRGASAVDPDTTMAVLVARLAAVHR
ncbi:MAG: DNA polymerase III subunit delta [Acidimicrobiales bacterium]